MNRTVERRRFVKLCAAAAVAAGANPGLLAAAGTTARLYHRTALVDDDGAPITAQNLDVGRTYVFHYPYATTPCFLLDLGRPVRAAVQLSTETGEPYVWPGGTGGDGSVVAFAAICAHRMTHPAKDVSFINYRHGKVRYLDSGDRPRERNGVIFCCSEKSVYDPSERRAGAGRPGEAAARHHPAPERARERCAVRARHHRRRDVRRLLREVRIPPRPGARDQRHPAPGRRDLGGHETSRRTRAPSCSADRRRPVAATPSRHGRGREDSMQSTSCTNHPLRIAGLDHVVLRCARFDATMAFYVDVLGCTLERELPELGLHQLRAGAALIDLVPVGSRLGGTEPPDAERANMAHFWPAHRRPGLGRPGTPSARARPRVRAARHPLRRRRPRPVRLRHRPRRQRGGAQGRPGTAGGLNPRRQVRDHFPPRRGDGRRAFLNPAPTKIRRFFFTLTNRLGPGRREAPSSFERCLPGSAGILPANGRRPAIVQAGKMPALPGRAPRAWSRQLVDS